MPVAPVYGWSRNATTGATIPQWVPQGASATATTTSAAARYFYSVQTTPTSVTTTLPWVSVSPKEWVEHSYYVALARVRVSIVQARTAEQLALEQWRAEEVRERTALRAAASARSRALLLSHLTPEQRRTFEEKGWFVVEGGRSKQFYRIHAGYIAGNIHVLQSGKVTHRLCAHCDDSIPLFDQLLAQKICLQFDEDAFLQVANRHAA